ncbi:hypothetical protein ACH5RR_036128 [Cinchona calisaya]|uniref:Uncharacterized protein n=1 Tax=Cinchona calisaya TaxID=153742 RepID=A0ABD2Y727_9GENT
MDHKDIRDCEEDDFFYAELRRQLLMLTAEDDDEDQENRHTYNTAKSIKQRLNASPASMLQLPGCYHNWSGSNANESVPTWLFNLWNSGNGTGVFIPQIIKSTRRYKPRKKNNERGRMYKPVTNVK